MFDLGSGYCMAYFLMRTHKFDFQFIRIADYIAEIVKTNWLNYFQQIIYIPVHRLGYCTFCI